MKPSEIIREGKVQFFERGWNRGLLLGPDGRVCALGALGVAYCGVERLDRVGYMIFDEDGPARDAAVFVASVVPANSRSQCDPIGDVFTFNDRAESLNDVIDLFDKAEKLAEASEASA